MPINLKPHNIETYQKVIEKFNESNKVAIIHPTGTGKMFVTLKLLEDNKDKKAIYLAPSNAILHDVKKNIFAEGMTMVDFPLLKRITYQKLAKMSDEEIEELDVDIIILDEFHHCGSPEWGKGVERLTQRNKSANILGLSATPLRYFDGLRNMADEMFENHVASEMSLEEAIESGILPEATYVSALYGYDKELIDMQENIDKTKDKEKQQQAQETFNILKEKLDENTKKLPELFSQYMQNPNGKYIIFCRNIEDMSKKIQQAQKMFGKVNPNITIRAVSSKIKESDRVLAEFEQDNNEDTLKLLYAVDMLNEGYHISDLDGVIMMRPTLSPTIYTQQLGRALTVGGAKTPIVLDLVNNSDSCKIIEDFVERMKQYKGNEGSERTGEIKKSRISILDKTKEFREIVEKIKDLSSKKAVSLEEKIQIFEKFSQTGEELAGNTIFEGYPIGQWAMQIRAVLKRINNEKDEEQTLNLTKEQLKRLQKLGILERQIDSTIDEKINSLVEWRKKYPKATVAHIVSKDVLSEYAKTEEELKKIIEEYEKMLKYYDYIRARKSQGKLNESQIEKCREGTVGGVFGNSTDVNNETNTLMKKYGLNKETITLIRKQYGSIDEFRKIYINAICNHNVDKVINKKILKNENLIRKFDLSSPDWILRNSGLTDIIRDVLGSDTFFADYGGLEEKIIKLIREDRFTKQEEQVLFMYYGINHEKRENQTQIAKNISKSNTRIQQIIGKSIRKLRFPTRIKILNLENRIFDIDFDLQRKIIEEYFKDFDIFIPKEPTSMDDETKNKLTKMLSDAVEKTQKRNEQVEIIKKMPEEQQLEILKTKFGEKISSSDISVVPPWDMVYKCFERTNYVDINEELVRYNWSRLTEISYKECLDSKYCQNKIVEFVEFIITNTTNSELAVAEKKEELEKIISNTEYFSEEKKSELKEMLNEKTRVAVKEKILEKLGAFDPVKPMLLELNLKELDLSERSYNCLKRAGINTVKDLMENTVEDLMVGTNLNQKEIYEIIKKMQYNIGIEMVDGHFEYKSIKSNISIDENTKIQIEEEINNSDVLDENEKENLRTMLNEKYQETKERRTKGEEERRMKDEEENLRSEILNAVKTIPDRIMKITIEELDLSVRSYHALIRANYKTVEDFIGKSTKELMWIRNFGKKSYDETIEKLKSLGLKTENGYYINPTNSEPDINKMMELEERITSSECISEEKKEELKKLLYETFNVTRSDKQKIKDNLENIESSEFFEEMSKEELIKHILEQQKTIAKQREEIDKLSSKELEVKDE